MNNKKPSGRAKQKQILFIVVVIFIVALVITAIVSTALDNYTAKKTAEEASSIAEEESLSEEASLAEETETVSDSIVDSETTEDEETDADENWQTTTTETTTSETATYDDEDDTDAYDNTLVPATVVDIVDGETLKVQTSTRIFNVSMIGIDPIDEEGSVAYLKQVVPAGTDIWLLYDESTTDLEGNDTCYIFTAIILNFDSYSIVTQNMLQAQLIKNGYAQFVNEYPNSRYNTKLELVGDE